MRILVIGKYPPILGGVSSQTYFTCNALVEKGQQVYVLTNGNESEFSLTQYSTHSDRNGLSKLSNPTIVDICGLQEFSYVPWAQPNLSRFIGAALRVVREHNIDLIVGWYLEPYGVAASVVGQAMGIPYLLRHAGSDLGKLTLNPDLLEVYRYAIQGAAAVITSGHSSEVLEKLVNLLGAQPSKVVALHKSRLPHEFRKQKSNPPSTKYISELASRADWFDHFQLPSSSKRWLKKCADNLDFRHPMIAIYGKVGENKGTWDLLSALELIPEAVEFRLICLSGGKPDDYARLINCIETSSRLSRQTVVIPPCFPWEVPSFLRSVDAVCCLERRFPVSFHAPRLPREVLASASCLVISREIANKQSFRDSLIDGKNCYIISDPSDRKELAFVLAKLMTDPSQRRIVAKHGWYLSKTVEQLMIHEDSMASAICDLGIELCVA